MGQRALQCPVRFPRPGPAGAWARVHGVLRRLPDGGVWRAAYTVDSLGMPSVLCHFIGGPTVAVFVAYAFSLGCGYYFTSPAFLGGAFVSDMKILFSM